MAYICPYCGSVMKLADDEVLVCPNSSCNYSCDEDDYGDGEEFNFLYPTKEDICGPEDDGDDDDDDDSGETYDEVYGELSDD